MKKIPRAKHQNVKGKRLKSRRYNNKKQLNKRKVAEVLIIIIVIIMLMGMIIHIVVFGHITTSMTDIIRQSDHFLRLMTMVIILIQ